MAIGALREESCVLWAPTADLGGLPSPPQLLPGLRFSIHSIFSLGGATLWDHRITQYSKRANLRGSLGNEYLSQPLATLSLLIIYWSPAMGLLTGLTRWREGGSCPGLLSRDSWNQVAASLEKKRLVSVHWAIWVGISTGRNLCLMSLEEGGLDAMAPVSFTYVSLCVCV